jgi:hypothetical protein
MQKQALTVGNINYAAYKDSDNLFSPIESIEEFILIKSALTTNTLKVITLTDLITPIQLRNFYYFSSVAASNKTIDLKVKDDLGNTVFRTNFAINFANVTLPPILLQPSFTIELMATANCESINFVCKRIGFVDVKNK